MIPTNDGKGTEVIVSIINFRPGGRAIKNYDYVYTRESDHIFNVVINEDLSDQDMERIVKAVVKMIRNLQEKAKTIFRQDPNAILDSSKGFWSVMLILVFISKMGKLIFLMRSNRMATQIIKVHIVTIRHFR